MIIRATTETIEGLVTYRLILLVVGGVLAVAPAARADFFDDARKTFTKDIPHFFQDDVPCTFGGQPTSGARQSCRQDKPAPSRPARSTDRPAPR